MVTTSLENLPSSKETLSTFVYEQLRQDILTVAILPGAKLPVRQLASRFGVGISPIREALNRLLADGLLTLSDHKGFAVTPMTVEAIEDITLARCHLNAVAIRSSIEKGGEEWEEKVLVAYHRLSRAPRNEQCGIRSDQWEKAHRDFHSALISASGSRKLEGFCEQLFQDAERYRVVSRREELRYGELVAESDNHHHLEHQELLNAVLSRDADEAARLLMSHFSRTRELFKAAAQANDIFRKQAEE